MRTPSSGRLTGVVNGHFIMSKPVFSRQCPAETLPASVQLSSEPGQCKLAESDGPIDHTGSHDRLIAEQWMVEAAGPRTSRDRTVEPAPQNSIALS